MVFSCSLQFASVAQVLFVFCFYEDKLCTENDSKLVHICDKQLPWGEHCILCTSAFGNESNLSYDATNNRLGVVGTGYSPNITLSDAATIAWDTTTGQVATFTFVSSNRTVGAPSSLVSGAFYALAVIQNAGSNTLTWNSVFKWANGTAPTLSTAAAAQDYFVFRSNGTNLYEQGRSQGVA